MDLIKFNHITQMSVRLQEAQTEWCDHGIFETNWTILQIHLSMHI